VTVQGRAIGSGIGTSNGCGSDAVTAVTRLRQPKCASTDAKLPAGYLLRSLLQVQFYQDRPQLFAKMSRPHTFGFLLYRVSGNSLPDGVAPRPVRTFNATVPSHWADEQLPPLLALRIQALGRATAAGMLHGFHADTLGLLCVDTQ
jgi:hypothetical protein